MSTAFGKIFASRRSRYQRQRPLRWWLLVLGLIATPWAVGDTVAVIYPEVRDPYRRVFLQIKAGIEAELGEKVAIYVIGKDEPPAAVSQWIERHNIDSVIALGNRGIKSVRPDLTGPTVIGAAILKPGSSRYTGISLNPAPEQLMKGLLGIAPTITHIHAVFEPRHNQWVMDRAESQLAKMGLELIAHPVEGLREAAKTYRAIQKKLDNETEALWLPLGGPSRDKALLQSILETAWSEHQFVVSSNLAEVRRGALFSTYPDNEGMGRELGILLRAQEAGPPDQGEVRFVTTLFKAINVRTAEHLGMRLNRNELATFEFVYPPR